MVGQGSLSPSLYVFYFFSYTQALCENVCSFFCHFRRERLHKTDSLIKDIECEHANSPDVGLQKHYSIVTKNGGTKS